MKKSALIYNVCRLAVLVVLLFGVGSLSAVAQEVIRVTGKVVSKDKGQPLMGVNVTDIPSGRIMAQTDEDGRFAIDVRSNTTLRFSMVGAKTTSVKIKGKNYIDISMEAEDVFLGEAVVAAKRITDKVMPEPTDIEVKGNWAYIRTRVRVPREMFSHDTRLVVQPFLNKVTRNELTLMRPMVYDAQTYNKTQDRLYNFEMDAPGADPLAKYVTIKNDSTKEVGKKNDIIGYADSVYLENPKEMFSCDIYMAIENYHRILYRDTTVIARGTINPLRWLKYSFGSTFVTDPSLFPKAEMQLRDSKGEVNLRFPIGKATLDMSDPQNAAEIEKLRQQIESIGQTKDATLQALSMEGTSSPDGLYSSNLSLAQKRMDFALNYLRQQVPENMRQNMKFTSKAQVAPWSEVVRLMRADSLDEEADKIEYIINHNSKIDLQGRAIRKLPFYSSLLQGKYLPRLRRVGYSMNYSVFRQLTIDEIKQLYEKDYRQLSRFEFFQLYRAESDSVQREKELRQALEMYPSFIVAANDLSATLIERHAADPDILRPFAGKKAPIVVNINQMVALLETGHFTECDSIAEFVPETEDTRLLLAVSGMLNGNYSKENFDAVAETGLQNRLVALLAMKENKEALKLSKELPDDEAITHYLRAVCLNRDEQPIEAYEELKKAFKMDPSLEKIAPLDGDVNDLLLDKK